MGISMPTSTTVTASRVVGATAGFIGAIAEAVDDHTLGAQQMLLLMALYIHGELNQNDLPKYTGVDRSANSRNIKRFGAGSGVLNRVTGAKTFEQGDGFVEAYRDPMNQRFQMVRLTPRGRAVIESAAMQVAHYFS